MNERMNDILLALLYVKSHVAVLLFSTFFAFFIVLFYSHDSCSIRICLSVSNHLVPNACIFSFYRLPYSGICKNGPSQQWRFVRRYLVTSFHWHWIDLHVPWPRFSRCDLELRFLVWYVTCGDGLADATVHVKKAVLYMHYYEMVRTDDLFGTKLVYGILYVLLLIVSLFSCVRTSIQYNKTQAKVWS